MDAIGPGETQLLVVERAIEAMERDLRDLKRETIELSQRIWDAWGDVRIRASETCTASFAGTLQDCTGAGWVGQTVVIKNHVGGATLATVTTTTGGAFSGSITIPVAGMSVDVTTSGIPFYNDFSTTKTFACSSNSVGTISPTPIVNHAPTLNALSPANNVSICGSSPATTVNLSGITDGDSGTQSLTVTATSNNTAFIPNPSVTYTSPNTTGSILWTPNAGVYGSATISVTVTDSGGTSCGGVNKVTRTFGVSNTEQCGPPTLDPLSNVGIAQNAAAQTTNLTGISYGPNTAGCGGTTLTVIAVSTNPGLIPNPTVTYTSANATGLLSWQQLPGTGAGTAIISVSVTSNIPGGVIPPCRTNVVSRSFTVTVT